MYPREDAHEGPYLPEQQPVSGWREAKSAWHSHSVHEWFLEGEILTYFAKNAFGRWFCAEGKGQVVDLREVATKVSHPVDTRAVCRSKNLVERRIKEFDR